MIKGIVDRFEKDIVVVEIKNGDDTQDFPRSIFPKDIEVGHVVYIDGDKVRIDREETENLEREIKELMDDVWED
ncbi:DUF3006 domain-containing protein [Terrilactibacillus laevilacticus]|uniref:DUF3006 domain-containing protein n=1 Tax=Terrilactibacillus laevilacticus TaxID=1380157 RepID=A0ABW5PNU2_9BACI|nr:DUF3006 domain-containing protein [Terrilactibacillus laevilacticus]